MPFRNTDFLLFGIGAAIAIILILVPFSRARHEMPQWSRWAWWAAGISGLGWSALGFARLVWSSSLTEHQQQFLKRDRSFVGGFLLGILFTLIVSGELRRASRALEHFKPSKHGPNNGEKSDVA